MPFRLEISTDRGAWWGTVHGVAKSWTQLILEKRFLSSEMAQR